MTNFLITSGVIAVLASGAVLVARPGLLSHDGRGGPPNPFLEAFDQDGDKQLSPEEIAAVPKILSAMDANEDGMIQHDELPRPPRRGGPRGEREGRPEGEFTLFGIGDRECGNGDCEKNSPAADEISVQSEPKGTVTVQDGYRTDPRDGGRPVSLIAAALGVTAQQFRGAFSRVRPSRGGPPGAERVRANKEVLMAALAPLGVSNDRLDEVSNYYRYRPEAGEMWPVRPASVRAVEVDGRITGFEIIDGGSGYLSAPQIVVHGYPEIRAAVTLGYSEEFRRNGRIEHIEIQEN